MTQQKEPQEYSACPELTGPEFRVLTGIVSQIFNNTKKLPGGSYAFSECEFIFDREAGMDKTFASLFYKIDELNAKRFKERTKKLS